jgi:enoyl-CoA hydratase/carnithine racemase
MSNISRLVALLGAARTKDIIFTARLIEASEALALLSEVVPDADALQRCADCARTSSAMKAKT